MRLAARHELRRRADAAPDDVLDRLAALFSRGVHRHGVGAVERELAVRERRVQRREPVPAPEGTEEMLLMDPLRRRRVEAAVIRCIRNGPEAILREGAVLFQ